MKSLWSAENVFTRSKQIPNVSILKESIMPKEIQFQKRLCQLDKRALYRRGGGCYFASFLQKWKVYQLLRTLYFMPYLLVKIKILFVFYSLYRLRQIWTVWYTYTYNSLKKIVSLSWSLKLFKLKTAENCASINTQKRATFQW